MKIEQKNFGIKKISEKKLKEKTKKISVREAAVSSVMDGAGSKYITPYALAIGANNAQIGLLTSIPSLLGNLSQLFTSRLLERCSRKKIIVTGVLLQALMWIPIILVGYLSFYQKIIINFAPKLIILFYTALVLFGSFVSPAWNSLMRDNIGEKRGDYFGNRHKIAGIVSLVVMLACGFILDFFSKINLFFGFLILFGVALIARLVAVFFLTKHYEPELKLEKGYYFSLWQFIRKIPQSNFGKFTVVISLISFGTAIASPFFAVYMLKNLNFDYAVWTLIVVVNLFSSLIFMPFWGKFADNYGNLRVLKWTGILIPFIPLFWFFTILFIKINVMFVIIYLLIVEFFSGFVWSGFNLCAVNFIYDAVTREKIALCISYYNIFNGIGVFVGAILGGVIASSKFGFFGISAILFIFLLSALMRFLPYIFLMHKIKEVRGVKEYKEGELGREIGQILLPIPFKFMRNHSHI